MSLEAGRVGVRNDQVDAYGRINPNDTLIDDIIRDLPGWTDMPVWRGGTEAILPENDDEPETSPILADIQYPDALRNNQYFLYRESPTDVDGMAKIRRIQGNTLVWKQIVQNGNFANTNNWTVDAATFTVSNNIATVTPTARWGGIYINTVSDFIQSHKYYVKFGYKKTTADADLYFEFNTKRFTLENSTDWEEISEIVTPTSSRALLTFTDARTSDWDSYMLRNVMVFDLTAMGLDSLSLAEVKQWFSNYYLLPYYAYTSGKLLPFMGEELKTTGKNLLKFSSTQSATINGITWTNNEDGTYTANGTATADSVFQVQFSGLEGNYLFSGCADDGSSQKWNVYVWDFVNSRRAKMWDKTTNVSNIYNLSQSGEVYCDRNITYGVQLRVMNGQTVSNLIFKPMLRFGDIADNTFEGYKGFIVDLPTLDFFPTGMKAAGSIYDELLPDKAITRLGSVTLDGSSDEDWQFYEWSSGKYRAYISVLDIDTSTPDDQVANIMSNLFPTIAYGTLNYNVNAISGRYITAQINIIEDKASSLADWRTWLSNNPLTVYYELAEPIIEPTIIIE